jgi:hypothetical protein
MLLVARCVGPATGSTQTNGTPLTPISVTPLLVAYYRFAFDVWSGRNLAAIAGDGDLAIYDNGLKSLAHKWLEVIENCDAPEEIKRPLVCGLNIAFREGIAHGVSEARKQLRTVMAAESQTETLGPTFVPTPPPECDAGGSILDLPPTGCTTKEDDAASGSIQDPDPTDQQPPQIAPEPEPPEAPRDDEVDEIPAPSSDVTRTHDCAESDTAVPTKKAVARQRMTPMIDSPIAVQRLDDYLKSSNLGLTDFAGRARINDRTLRRFRATGRIRRDILGNIAEAMGTTKEALLQPE